MRKTAFVLAFVTALTVVACAGPGARPAVAPNPAVNVTISGPAAPGPYVANGSIDATSGRGSLQMLDTMKFQPNEVRVKAGTAVTLELKNGGSLPHDLLSPGLGVDTAVEAPGGGTATVSFNAPAAPGTYRFWCDQPGHAQAGMVGQVIVVE